MNYPVLTQIRHVTVYPDCAQVTRQGAIALTGTERVLIVPNLPARLDPDSITVTGYGSAEVLLLGVELHRITPAPPDSDATEALTAQIQTVEAQKRQHQAEREALQLQRRFLQNLSEQSAGTFAQELAQENVSVVKTERVLAFFREQYLAGQIELTQLDEGDRTLDEQLHQLRQRLQQHQTAPPPESLQLWLTVDPFGSGDYHVEVTYRIDQVAWQPCYDLRWDSRNPHLNLSYLAKVRQNTGEPWPDVALTLSTAHPYPDSQLPSLEPWYVDLPLNPFVNLRSGRSRYQAATQELKPRPPTDGPAHLPELEEVEGITKVTLGIQGTATIPSTGLSETVTILNADLDVTWHLIALPPLSDQAYIALTAINPPDHVPLLAGHANLFRDAMFIGTVAIAEIAPGETLPLHFGVDPTVEIQRTLSDRKVDKNLIGNRRRITYTYTLTLTNTAEHPQQIHLTDQLPVSRNDKLKVQLNRVKPKVDPDETGFLTWELELIPTTPQEITYQFSVEYPPDLTITGLES
ncbi:mucoidy inhibitor MuiA family protein [Spirulina major CS-329]|uniref:mucoidy inhibitor MuiA family protein n=1 Tax=Spirulina TaxID=1154 RepID=UPI0023307CCB|nr:MULTISPECIES: mucoidy inhibitor MuiA family protein [Spirulina]MDB9494767.1 mucoidy inhibitor MuiA family protein [Spirulina subsalsa CS-330]MDB9503889.1 mucoidy inhibitor MuiA family protein [Spirulina major CS-329]